MKTETKLKINKVATDLIHRFQTHDIGTQAAALSWFLLQSSIPMLMVLVSVVSRVLEDNVEAIYSFVDFLPSSSQQMVMWVIDTMIVNSSSASVTIITILFALWSATNGMDKLIKSINVAYGLESERNTVKQRILSVLYTIVFILFVVFLLVSQIYGPSLLTFIKNNVLSIFTEHSRGGILEQIIGTLTSPLFRITLTLIPLLIISLAVGLLYRHAPYTKEDKIPFKDAFKGGLLATVSIFLATFVYSFFLNNFSKQSVIYGALAGMLALFIWLTILTNVLIIGAELIDSVRENYEVDSEAEVEQYARENTSLRATVENTLEESKTKAKNKDKNLSKKDLRKEFRNIRYHMDRDYKLMCDYNIYTKFLNSDFFKEAKSIFIYVSVSDEVDTIEIIKKALELGKLVYVPHIVDEDNRIMRPVRLYDVADLDDGVYDIPTSYTMEYCDNPDITVIPGLGFDRDKNRIGYGAGYYDRFLNSHHTTSIGLFMSIFETSFIATDEYDRKLDYIITEKEIF